jgi:hypothetical protein
MPYNVKTRKILNALTVERKDTLYKNAIIIKRRTRDWYLKALGKPTSLYKQAASNRLRNNKTW